MEVRFLIPPVISKEKKEQIEKETKQKEEVCRVYGNYLISLANLCFEKCIDTESIKFTKKEEKCVHEFFYKFVDAHQYSYYKFININKISEDPSHIERSDEYGDFYDLLENLHKE